MTFEEASRWIASQDRRIEALEAALRDLIDYTDITKHIDADAVTERVKRARVVLGLTAETACVHRWYISNTATQTCYACGATQQGNGPIEPSTSDRGEKR